MLWTASRDLKSVEVVLIDREGHGRRLLRSMIARLGLPTIHEFSHPSQAARAFQHLLPDLIFVEADRVAAEEEGGGDEAGAAHALGGTIPFLRALRTGRLNTNPFTVALATAWQPTPLTLQRLAAAGADGVLAKPASQRQVEDLIGQMVDARRDFIATADYIGPDRRRSAREGAGVPTVPVPNTLRMKVGGQYSPIVLLTEVRRAQQAINRIRVVRLGFQAAFLVMVARPGLEDGPLEPPTVEALARIPAIMDDMLKRVPEDRRPWPALWAKAATLRQLVDRTLDPLRTDVVPEDLRRASLEVAAEAGDRRDLDLLEQEVLAAVSAYRDRLDALALAKASERADVAAVAA